MPTLVLAFAFAVQDDARIEELVRKLSDPSIEVREEAGRELVRIGAKAVPFLEKAAASGDPEARERAAAALRKIRARQRAADLGLEKLIPAEVRAKIPDLLERAGAETAEEKVKLLEELRAAVETGAITERDLAWIGALLRGPVSAALRTHVYVAVRRWWYDSSDTVLRDAGRKTLEEMGEGFLRDWPRILLRIADAPNEPAIFDPEVVSSNRSGTDEGQISAAAIAELAELGGLEIVPVLVDIATDAGADAAARKAAIAAVGLVRRKWAAKKKE